MSPKRHIKKFLDHLHKLNMDGHIDTPDKYAAIKDIEIGVHKLRQAFEYSGEMKPDKRHSDIKTSQNKIKNISPFPACKRAF